MCWFFLTCKCGHQADLDSFCRTEFFGELPPGQFQCPRCGHAWKRHESEHRIITAGSESMIIPGKVEIIPIERRL